MAARKLAAVGADIGVAAYHRNPETLGSRAEPFEHRGGLVLAIRPHSVDHGERATAHRRYVGDVDHHPAPAGEPRVTGHELIHEALDGEQKVAVAVRDRRAVVAHRHGAGAIEAEARGGEADIGLGLQAVAGAERVGKRAQHHAAFRDMAWKPVSGLAKGG